MSRVIYEELQDKEGNVHYLHTEDKVVFDENGQSLRAAMKEVQFEDYTGTAELPSVETAVAGITRGRKWTDLFGNIKAALKGLKAKDEAIEGSMGDAFSEEKSYAVGDYAIYKDVLYKFTAAKTAGSWDAAKVRAVTVVGEVCSLNANITTVSGKIPTKYAGSASAGGSAASAVKLDTSAGSATQPVYFSGGKPVACTHTLGKSVPANAVFTDTNTKAIREIVNLNFISAGEKSYAYVAKVKCGLISAAIIGSVGNMFDGISKEDTVEGSYVVWVQGSVSGSKQCELVWMPYN